METLNISTKKTVFRHQLQCRIQLRHQSHSLLHKRNNTRTTTTSYSTTKTRRTNDSLSFQETKEEVKYIDPQNPTAQLPNTGTKESSTAGLAIFSALAGLSLSDLQNAKRRPKLTSRLRKPRNSRRLFLFVFEKYPPN